MPEVASWTELARGQQSQGLFSLLRRFGAEVALSELGLPAAEVWAGQALLETEPDCAEEALDSLPFEVFCQALIAPLLGLAAHLQQKIFGQAAPELNREQRLQVVEKMLARNIGLPMTEKVAWLTGERFGSKRSWTEERLLQLLALTYFYPVAELRQKMLEAGGIGPLAASLGQAQGDPLATRVVTRCLLDPPPRTHPAWNELLRRSSPLERFVLVSRLAGKLDLVWSGRAEGLARLLAGHYGADPETLQSALALEDLTQLVERLEKDGPDGLKAVMLRPLSPFRPALAQSLEGDPKFPCWVDCKYDGIRLLLHKEWDSLGHLRLAAYTRRRNDWSEMVEGLEAMLRSLSPYSLIMDGELHGRVLDMEGVARPASVYEVHECLRGELRIPLKYVAFDLLYMNGRDLTAQPFQQRRQQLELMLQARTQKPGLPLELAQGSVVTGKAELNRLYEQFRRQGHEGCMVKDLQAAYPLAVRSPAWLKRKPLESADLVLTAAYWGESSREGQRMFDSYSMAARSKEGWREVGTVGGVDARLTAQLVAEIWRSGLLTGVQRLRESNRGRAAGVELKPHLVVTVAYEDILWDGPAAEVSLRSPRILQLRSGEMPLEESTPWEDLQRRALRSRLS
ncbi:MAG: ATP-dependent DNA ligase [Candidatus Eremiobacteraeota bacterium]|nr:ATP-dependent DNA ligase [Candidatus Eremiobacteraeota bacterium]MCW5867136.1 ATP-dependent DNA ligase [Candidatus Eremiobacteraeota bacterium]